MSTQEIYNYLYVNPRLSLAGQPDAEQLRAAAAEGFEAVINLATQNLSFPLEEEAELARSLGMRYEHIPVAWGSPQPADFAAFELAMQSCANSKTLLHCAANFRAMLSTLGEGSLLTMSFQEAG